MEKEGRYEEERKRGVRLREKGREWKRTNEMKRENGREGE